VTDAASEHSVGRDPGPRGRDDVPYRITHHHGRARSGLLERDLDQIGIRLRVLDVGGARSIVRVLVRVEQTEVVLELLALRRAREITRRPASRHVASRSLTPRKG
jgi:hypothetical protein